MNNLYIPMIGLTPHGGNRVLVQIANYIALKGVSVTVFYPKGSKYSMPFKFDDKICLKPLGINCKYKSIRILFFFTSLFFKLIMNKGTIFANHFSTFYPAFLLSFFKNDYFYFVQDIENEFYDSRNGIFWRLISYLCKISYNSKRIISANSYLTNKLKAQNKHVLYEFNIGVDSVFFDYNNISNKKFDFVYFPRDEKHKGFDRFITLVSNEKFIAKKPKVAFVSQGYDFVKYIPPTLDVTYFSPCNDIELINILDSSCFLLLTSYHEGFALPPLEAMSRGLPCVLYNCGGPSIYCDLNNSISVDDDEEFLNAVLYMIQCKEDLVERSDYCIKTANKYKISEQLDKLFVFLRG